MKLFVIIFLSTACTTSSQQVPGSVKFLEHDAKVLRQGASYTTSVIHQNPKHPDQHAESTINVDFNPQKPKQIRLLQNQQNGSYQGYSKVQQKRPKAIQTYNYSNLQALQRQPQQYSIDEKIPQANQIHTSIQHPPFNSPQSQSFNVGYSVSFTGEQPRKKTPRSFSRQKLENAEIITGSRKDTVQKPSTDFESNDFVTNALIELKKQKVSGIKPKLHKFSNSKENDAKNFIGNLAPKTQQFLSFLGDAKPIASSNIRFRQQLVGNEAQGTQVVQSSWTNLSPSVEIYHSKELPQNHAFSPKEQMEQSKKFDHAAALEKSQGFDYTNALEGQSEKKPANLVQPHREVSTETNQRPSEQLEINQHAQVHPETNQQNFFQTFTDLGTTSEANPLVIPFNANFGSIQAPVVPFENFQIAQRTEDLQGIGKQFPVFQAQVAEVSPKFPIDVTLVRDPVLAANGKNLPSDPHTIAVPFDTAMLQAMQQKLLTSSQPIHSFDAGKGQVQLLQGNVGIAGQQFQGQVGNLQVQPLQGVQQNVFQGQGFQEFQQVQPSQQFKVFEAPQHGLFFNKDFENYFDQYYDKMQAQESKRESVTIRYPKINTNNNNNNKIRSTTGIEILRELQPPPMQIARHRRMFMG